MSQYSETKWPIRECSSLVIRRFQFSHKNACFTPWGPFFFRMRCCVPPVIVGVEVAAIVVRLEYPPPPPSSCSLFSSSLFSFVSCIIALLVSDVLNLSFFFSFHLLLLNGLLFEDGCMHRSRTCEIANFLASDKAMVNWSVFACIHLYSGIAYFVTG